MASALILLIYLLVDLGRVPSAVAARDTSPLWDLNDVAKLADLLHQAQGKDRAGFLDVLEAADPDNNGSTDDSESTQDDDDTPDHDDGDKDGTDSSPTTEKDSSTPPTDPPKSSKSSRKPRVPPGHSSRSTRSTRGINPQSDKDSDLRWFNAEAFLRWIVQGLVTIYETLVQLMLLPLRIIISVIDL